MRRHRISGQAGSPAEVEPFAGERLPSVRRRPCFFLCGILVSLLTLLLPGPTRAFGAADRAAVHDVPYFAQTPRLCGGAAAAMLLRYHGDRAARPLGFTYLLDASRRGIATTALADGVRSRSFVVDAGDGRTMRQLQERLRTRPVVVLVAAGGKDQYHYVVVLGVRDDHVIVHDPAVGPGLSLAGDEFRARWEKARHWMLDVRPAAAESTQTTETTETAHPRSPETPQAPQAPRTPRTTDRTLQPDDQKTPAPDSCEIEAVRAVALARAGHLDAAGDLLSALADRGCAGAWRELASVRILADRYEDAVAAAENAVAVRADDDHARDVLGTAHYLRGDTPAALRAWNRMGRPLVYSFSVSGGSPRTRRTVHTGTPIARDSMLTASSLRHAVRRARALPSVETASVRISAAAPGEVHVRAVIVERAPARSELLRTALRATADREVRLVFPSGLGRADVWEARARWWARAPSFELFLHVPDAPKRGWVLEAGGGRDRQWYRTAGAGVVEERTRTAGIAASSWIASDHHLQVGLRHFESESRARGGRRSRDFVSVELGWRASALHDRLRFGARVAPWFVPGDGRTLVRASLSGSFRLEKSRRADLAIRAGGDWVDANSPRYLWTGAGTGLGRPHLFRAHPLIEDGTLDGRAFGRSLLFAGLEATFWRSFPGFPVGVATFADGVSSASEPGAAPFRWDAGAGGRIAVPGTTAVLAVDWARGLNDGQEAVSARLYSISQF